MDRPVLSGVKPERVGKPVNAFKLHKAWRRWRRADYVLIGRDALIIAVRAARQQDRAM